MGYQYPGLMNKSLISKLTDRYRKADRRLLLLDYDGTLIDYTPIPGTDPLPEQIFDILSKIIYSQRSEVFIITGRSFRDIEIILGKLQVNIIAEHGAMKRENGIWENQINDNCLWKETIRPVLDQMTHSCPESFIEEKPFSLTWHYRNTESKSGYAFSRELINILKKNGALQNLKILDGNKVVEIMNNEVSKGQAAKKLLARNSFDFILSVGDDQTDEEMFAFFISDQNAFTVKVGNGETLAKYKLSGFNEVVSLLKNLSV